MNIITKISSSFNYRKGIYSARLMNIFRENIVWYSLMYMISNAYHTLTRRKYSFVSKPLDMKSVKTIALIYSKRHFNPNSDNSLPVRLQYSASNLARQIYTNFNDKEIIYLDHSEMMNVIPKVDLIVGIVCNNFIKVAKTNPEAKKVIFLVNSHPLFRLKVLIQESMALGKVFPYSEYVSPQIFLKAIRYTDHYIMIGNDFVKKTFVDQGIPPENITILNTGINDFLVPDPGKRPQGKVRVLYVGSHLAIRKGLFRVMQVWDELMKKNENRRELELVMVGGVDKFKKEVDDFVKKYTNVVFEGWVESNTEKYRNLLQSSHIQLNLSIEEGQVGCVLDGMCCGIVPIITMESGLGIVDKQEGFVVKHDDIVHIAECIAVLKNEAIRKEFETKTLEYIRNNHTWEKFDEGFKQALTK